MLYKHVSNKQTNSFNLSVHGNVFGRRFSMSTFEDEIVKFGRFSLFDGGNDKLLWIDSQACFLIHFVYMSYLNVNRIRFGIE